MTDYRRNIVTGDWVIVAPSRDARPGARLARPAGPLSRRDPGCPFCPGNEAMTPPPILERPEGAWSIRAFANKYPATDAHEVLVTCREHDRAPADLGDGDHAAVAGALRERFAALAAGEGVRVVLPLVNHGAAAGASLAHPHAQIVAATVLPPRVERRRTLAEEAGECLVCALAASERSAGERIVAEPAPGWSIVCPFASGAPGEMWIVPPHEASFAGADDAIAGAAIGDALRRLAAAYDDPPFNLVVHSALPGEAAALDHWWIRIAPRMTQLAGIEVGAGIGVNVIAPEAAAEALRAARTADGRMLDGDG